MALWLTQIAAHMAVAYEAGRAYVRAHPEQLPTRAQVAHVVAQALAPLRPVVGGHPVLGAAEREHLVQLIAGVTLRTVVAAAGDDPETVE